MNRMLQTAQDSDSQSLSRREIRARKANSPLGRVLRYVGLILGIYIGWNIGLFLAPDDAGADNLGYPIIMSSALGALFFLLTPYLTIGAFARLREELRRINASDLTAVGVGLLIGGLVSTLVAFPLSTLPGPFDQYLPVIALVVICSVAVIATLTKKHELAELVGLRKRVSDEPSESVVTRDVEAPAADRPPELLVDTSAIIDGRVVGLSTSGFLPHRLIVPQFVLHELQLVADSDDYSRRTRGTRGLQTLEEMRESPDVDIEVRQIDADGPDVDSQLVNVARSLEIPILSGDSNLERVASLQDVRLLNLHSLAELMRPALKAGDTIRLKLMQKGREYQQGVGFLDDGTMVVVDEGEPYVGSAVDIVITRTLQTSSGRMMFARLQSAEVAAE